MELSTSRPHELITPVARLLRARCGWTVPDSGSRSHGSIDVIDATLVAVGRGGGALATTTAFDEHPRVRYARSLRDAVVVHADDSGLITLAHGLAGRREMSIELHDQPHGRGAGRASIEKALTLVAAGELLFAAVSPGNVRSLRAFLASGFTPVCSEVNITPLPDIVAREDPV